MDLDCERVDVEFEEDAGGGLVVLEDLFVVSDGVLVGAQRGRARGYVRGGDDVEVVLVGDKGWGGSVWVEGEWGRQRTILGYLEGIVEGLYNVGKVRAEGEFRDDMCQVHD